MAASPHPPFARTRDMSLVTLHRTRRRPRAVGFVIAAAVKSTQPEIYKELAANLLPNGHIVAAGVVAVNRAQERGYTMLTAG